MDPGGANMIRVLATAIPIVLSMLIVVKRNISLTFVSFCIVGAILFITLLLYPDRWEYMRDDVLKFTLPVVVPTGLCIASVKKLPIFIRCVQWVSVFAAIVGLAYAVLYMIGAFVIESYNMTFSYSLLFPTCVMINRKKFIWKGIALLLMVEMLAIGSRGALLIAIAYWSFTLVWGKKSLGQIMIYGILIAAVYFLFFDSIIRILVDLFDAVGISSRTLTLLLNDELISHSSGRDELFEATWHLINKNPIFGSGVWADRQYFDGYCHNVFLELLLNYGYFGTSIILLIFSVKQIGIYSRIPFNHKVMYVMMLSLLCQLVASGSYLVSFNVGMFLGFSYLLSKLNRKGLDQDYVFS